MDARSIYVHIPFCEHICHYCDFNKVFLQNQPVNQYIAALEKEMEDRLPQGYGQYQTIYVGGGTPTALSPQQLDRVLRSVKKQAGSLQSPNEFTVEVNPEAVTDDHFQVMADHGVNRLSIGVQTFNEKLLKTLGRAHKPEDVTNTIKRARQFGFHNLSVDLMIGLPGQTLEDMKDSLKQALSFRVPHISAYGLKIEAHTVFYNQARKGKLSIIPEDKEAEMYEALIVHLKDAGLVPYEISNFAKEGFESEHNLTYWKNEEYVGIGAGAHGYVNKTRYANIGPVTHYIQAIEGGKTAVREEHIVSVSEQMEEEMFMGLRMEKGVSFQRFEEKFSRSITDVFPEAIEELINKGWIYVDDECVRLTEQGKLLGNLVFERFLL